MPFSFFCRDFSLSISFCGSCRVLDVRKIRVNWHRICRASIERKIATEKTDAVTREFVSYLTRRLGARVRNATLKALCLIVFSVVIFL